MPRPTHPFIHCSIKVIAAADKKHISVVVGFFAFSFSSFFMCCYLRFLIESLDCACTGSVVKKLCYQLAMSVI